MKKNRKTLKQLIVYNSIDGSLGGAADQMELTRQTISSAVNGTPVGKKVAQKISEFVNGEYSVAELMGVDNGNA